MNQEQVADRVANHVVALMGPETVNEALDPIWNKLHDAETALRQVGDRYDIAASYSGGPGERDAKEMVVLIGKLLKHINALTTKAFDRVAGAERKFIKQFGTPDDYADKQRREIFPR